MFFCLLYVEDIQKTPISYKSVVGSSSCHPWISYPLLKGTPFPPPLVVLLLSPTLCGLWTAARQASLSFTISWSLLKFMSIESVMPSNHFILCHPFLLLPSIFPSIRVFSSESALPIRWLKYWIFSFTFSPSNGYTGLISFRIDWFNLLVVQRTLRGLLHHSLKHQFFGAGPSLALVHDCWENCSFDYKDLCQLSDVSAF